MRTSRDCASSRPRRSEDARGMLFTALQDPDPVLIFEHASLLNVEGEIAADPQAVDIDYAAVRREGTDLSLITYGGSLIKAIEAAERLARGRRERRSHRPAQLAPARRRDDHRVDRENASCGDRG